MDEGSEVVKKTVTGWAQSQDQNPAIKMLNFFWRSEMTFDDYINQLSYFAIVFWEEPSLEG